MGSTRHGTGPTDRAPTPLLRRTGAYAGRRAGKLIGVLWLSWGMHPPALAAEGPIPGDFRRAQSGAAVSLLLRMQEEAHSGVPTPGWMARPSPRVRAVPGANGLVNDPTLDSPEFTTQSEVSLAVLDETVCAGYVDTGPGGGVSGISRSTDAGATWTDLGGLPGLSDPVLAVHSASGTFYQAKISLFAVVGVGIGVARSVDDCQTFSTLTNASPLTVAPDLEDKPWIAVDNSGGSGDGNVYVCWSRFVNGVLGGATDSALFFSRSVDGGLTFSNEQVISPPSDFFPFGCFVDVGPGGEVYVSWADRAANDVRFRRSLDAGTSWGSTVQVNAAPVRHPGIDRVIECEAGQGRPSLNGDIRMLAQTWLAVDTTGGPFDGHLYVTWAHDPPGAADNSDVFMARSTDGGTSWEPEIQLGGGNLTDQFEPFVRVGGRGTVAFAWYDRRNDPILNFDIDVYRTLSRDGGVSFEPIERLTDVSFPVPPLTGQPTSTGNFDPGRSACYMGEYLAIAADEHRVHYAWGDNRNTVVSTAYPSGRPDPDVFSTSHAIGCGDGVLDPGEACDDGNRNDVDGCSSSCEVVTAQEIPTLPGWGLGLVAILLLGSSLCATGHRQHPRRS